MVAEKRPSYRRVLFELSFTIKLFASVKGKELEKILNPRKGGKSEELTEIHKHGTCANGSSFLSGDSTVSCC